MTIGRGGGGAGGRGGGGEGAVEAGLGAEGANEAVRDVGGDVLHGIAVEEGEEGDVVEAGVSVVKATGDNVVGIVDEKVMR